MKLVSSATIAVLAAVTCIGAVGCAADNEEARSEDLGATESNLETGVDVPNPSGAYFAKVTANGTGCPKGSWEANISPDGKAFTVSFSQYEASVNPGQSMQIKDCTLAIDLRSPEGLSFAIGSFYYQGYSLLDSAGMKASQTAKYYFQGNPLPARELRSDMVGPFDDSYVFQDKIGVADLVWSPCGQTRRLNAQTRIVLQNDSRRSGSGYLNTSTVDAEINTVLRFGLTWRRC